MVKQVNFDLINDNIWKTMKIDLGYGFFSMDHKVVSLSKRINGVYKNHDKFSLEKLFMSVSTRLVYTT